MQSLKKAVFGLLLVLFAVMSASAQQLKIADDSSSGTYKKMLGEVIGVCSTDEFSISEIAVSGGAVGNLDALVNNKVDAAFMHSDVFLSNSQADPSYNRFKTLVALWPEPIHVLVLRQSKTSKNGTFSFGKAEFNSLSDLQGYTVGAAGGGVLTARILTGQGQGGFTVVDGGSGANVLKQLDNGDIAAAIFVGAAPLPNLEALDKTKYRLIPIGERIGQNVSNVYRQAKIAYPGLTNGPITTLAPLATLVTKPFQTPAKVNAQRALRACFSSHLPELQDSYSPNWTLVTPNDQGVLNNYLDIPAPTGKR